MTYFLKRVFFILLGYALASIASGMVVAVVFDGRGLISKPDLATMLSDSFGLCAIITMFIAIYAALPALIVVLIGEIRAIQNKVYYVLAGCLIGTALPIVVGIYTLIPTGVLFGPIAGLIYWYVAGRKASLRHATEA